MDPLGVEVNIIIDPLGVDVNIIKDPLGVKVNIIKDPLGVEVNTKLDEFTFWHISHSLKGIFLRCSLLREKKRICIKKRYVS